MVLDRYQVPGSTRYMSADEDIHVAHERSIVAPLFPRGLLPARQSTMEGRRVHHNGATGKQTGFW